MKSSLVYILILIYLYRVFLPARKLAFTRENILRAWEEVGIVPLNPRRVIQSETRDDCATLAQSSRVSNPQRVPNTPRAVSRKTRTAISLVTRNTPSSKKIKSLLGELNEGFQEAYAEKVLEEEAHRQYRELVEASKRIKTNVRRKLIEATIVTAQVVFKLREEREKADALKASRKANKLGKALDLITTSTTPSTTMPKRSSKQKKRGTHYPTNRIPSYHSTTAKRGQRLGGGTWKPWKRR